MLPSAATAQRSDVAPNVASPSEPPTRISDPSVSRYASTTHCCSARPPPRSRRIAGSATLTTVESTNTIVDPRMAATRTRRLRVRPSRCSTLADGRRVTVADYQIVNLEEVEDWL